MPPKSKSSKTHTATGHKKKRKGHAPKHQNTFAWKHNPNSKQTKRILAIPNVGLCRRCTEQIEWRKKYRKYRPIHKPKKWYVDTINQSIHQSDFRLID
jgi:Uncharacterized conserved protein (DUF2039)